MFANRAPHRDTSTPLPAYRPLAAAQPDGRTWSLCLAVSLPARQRLLAMLCCALFCASGSRVHRPRAGLGRSGRRRHGGRDHRPRATPSASGAARDGSTRSSATCPRARWSRSPVARRRARMGSSGSRCAGAPSQAGPRPSGWAIRRESPPPPSRSHRQHHRHRRLPPQHPRNLRPLPRQPRRLRLCPHPHPALVRRSPAQTASARGCARPRA